MAGLAPSPTRTSPGRARASRWGSFGPSWSLVRWRVGPTTAVDLTWLRPLLLLFLAKQLLVVLFIGPFTGHDEVDHFYYVARLAAGEGLGTVGQVRLPEAAAPYEGYVADYPYNAEVIQPPLYHGALAAVYRVLPGDDIERLYALRLFSIPLGAAVVWLAYLTARRLFPREPVVRLGVPLFVALQPQFSFEAAIVNHDILVVALLSLVVYLALVGLRRGFGPGLCLLIGLTTAAGLWTKVSFGLALPVVALALLIGAWDRRRAWRPAVLELIWQGALGVALPLVMIVPWFARNQRLYGDPTGAQRLRLIPDHGEQASTYREMLGSPGFWRGRLEDFWGNYGWRQIPFDPLEYQAIALFWGIAGVGLAAVVVRVALRRWRGGPPVLDGYQVRGLLVIAASVLALVFGVLYVGTIQFTQSRFAFPAMIGFAVLTMVGYAAWLPARARPYAVPVLVVLLVALNVVTALRFLIPFYFGPGGGAALLP